MKKLTWSAFIAFWSVTATLVLVGWLSPVGGHAGEDETGPRRVTLEELAEHSTAESCWQAIQGKVYDLTDYIPEHPTPPQVLVQWCGKEATEAYATKGYGRSHSPAADAMLERYYIGELVETGD